MAPSEHLVKLLDHFVDEKHVLQRRYFGGTAYYGPEGVAKILWRRAEDVPVMVPSDTPKHSKLRIEDFESVEPEVCLRF